MKIYKLYVRNEWDTEDIFYAHKEGSIKPFVYERLRHDDYIIDLYNYDADDISLYDYITEVLNGSDVWGYEEIELADLFIDEQKGESA